MGEQKITTFLTFNDQAEDAINLYTSIFPNAKVLDISRYPEGGPMPAGTFMSGTFEIDGQRFMALNGGPHFTFSEGISLFVTCEDQDEVDELWDRLGEGREGQCGWITDRFGVSWQIIPRAFIEMMADPDTAKVQRVVEAMLKMGKLDVATLQEAFEAK